MTAAEHAVCEVLRDGRPVGLGFAVGSSHVLTCAHVVNAVLKRAERDSTDPGHVVVQVEFPIGRSGSGDTGRTAILVEWLPGVGEAFDANDLALLELSEPVPGHVPALTGVRHRPPMRVQMWGPQDARPDGGHVTGEVLGENRSGRFQVDVGGGAFRVRPGFSGGPVWLPGTLQVVGMLAACGVEESAVDAYVLGMDRIAAVWPDWAVVEREPGRAGGRGEDLLGRVVEACRFVPDLAEAEVRRTRRFGQAHLIATRHVRIGSRLFRVDLPIVVHAGDVSAAEVEMAHSLLRQYRDSGYDDVTEASLVYTGVPATAVLREHAAQSGIDVRSLVEFQTGVDLRQFASRQHAELVADERYPQRGYVRQRFREPPDREVRGDALRERVLSWVAESEGHLVVVLAPFGHGKTYLLHELAREMHARPDYPAVPVLVRLAELERSHHIDELVGTQLTRGGERRVDLDRLAYLRREGRVVLLLDGFDELARRVSYDQVGAHLEEIIRAAEGRAKIVLASRREFFLSDRDTSVAFGQRLATSAGRRMVTITDFDGAQIREFLAARLDPKGADRWVALLTDLRLLDLAANPRMLTLLTGIGEDRLRAGSSEGGVTKAWVFEEVLRGWLTGEYERAHPYGTRAEPWLTAMRTALSDLATQLWIRELPSLSLDHLTGVATPLMTVPGADRLSLDQAVHLLGSGTALVRVGDGQFDFVHRSIMEWLVADQIARLLTTGDRTLLDQYLTPQLSPVQIDLLDELAGRELVTAWLEAAVNDSVQGVRGNALAISHQLGIAIAQRLVLQGQDLRGQDLSGRNLAGADLTGADLTDALLVGADLTGADLTRATLVRARLDRAVIRDAVVHTADLRDARALSADLRGIDWASAGNLRRAATLASRVDPAAAAVLASAGATTPEHPPSLQLAGPVGKALDFDPTGELLAISSGHNIQLWRTATGVPTRTLTGHTGSVWSVAWSPDGRHLATASEDNTARIWDTTGTLLRTLTGHTDEVVAAAWSPDGRHLATASEDNTARIWDTTGTLLRTLTGHTRSVWSVAWSPDGRHLATASDDNTARIWDTTTGTLQRTLNAQTATLAAQKLTLTEVLLRGLEGHTGSVWSVAWSPDGRHLATASDDNTLVWDATTGTLLRILTGHTGSVRSVAWSPDGRHLATASDDNTARIWDTTGTLQRTIGTQQRTIEALQRTLTGHARSVWSVAWSPDSRHLATAIKDNTAGIWDATTGTLQRTLTGHTGSVWSVAWSPDGRHLATASEDNTARIWDTTGTLLRTLTGHTGSVWSVAWSPDGRHLATASEDNTARIWDATTGTLQRTIAVTLQRTIGGTLLRTLTGHTASEWSVAWSPDGQHLATASDDDTTTTEIWDTATGKRQHTLVGHPGGVVAWSPDGRHLATASDDNTLVWDATTGTLLRTLTGHTGSVRSVAWSPDGRHPATASEDNTARIWDATTGTLLRTLTGHTGSVWSVAWSPDGRHLATASEDNTARIWDTTTGTLQAILLPLTDGWAIFHPGGSYSFEGTPEGRFWWAIGLTRCEPGELDEHVPAIMHVDSLTLLTPPPTQWSSGSTDDSRAPSSG